MESMIRLLLWYLHPHSDLFYGTPASKLREYRTAHKQAKVLVQELVTSIARGDSLSSKAIWQNILAHLRYMESLDVAA